MKEQVEGEKVNTPQQTSVLPLITPTLWNKDKALLSSLQSQIRTHYVETTPSSNLSLISYQQFSKLFPSPSIYESFKEENLSIISMHLKFNSYVHEKMAIYKWAPSILIAFATRFTLLGMVFPVLYVNAFDHYFRDFFLYRESKEKLISIQGQFVSKLSKEKNKIRRVCKFYELFGKEAMELGENGYYSRDINAIVQRVLSKKNQQSVSKSSINSPKKYIKFDEDSQYLFHTTITNEGHSLEESSLYLTPFFENYQNVKHLFQSPKAALSAISDHFSTLKEDYSYFRQNRKLIKEKTHPHLYIESYEKLLKFKDIKEETVYNLTKKIQMRVRRILELIKYQNSGQFFISGFSFVNMRHLNKHYDLLEEQRFNVETNLADLALFYGVLAVPKLLQLIIKRSVRM